MDILKKEKTIQLNKVRDIVNCGSLEEINLIVDTMDGKIKLYFKENWMNILNEFVDCMRPTKLCLGIRTTCRVENFF